MLLQALQHRLDAPFLSGSDTHESSESLLEQAWEEGLRKAREDIDEQDRLGQGARPEMLADGLIYLFKLDPELEFLGAEGPERLQIGTPQGEVRVALVHQANPKSIAKALDNLGSTPGLKVGLRELWRPLKPTWKATLRAMEALEAQEGMRWHWLVRQDAERLLALDGLLKASTSGDLSGPGGVPFQSAQVEAWARQTLALPEWGITVFLKAQASGSGKDIQAGEGIAQVPRPGPAAPAGATGAGVLRILRRLRIASVDRLLKECRQDGRELTRKALVEELGRGGSGLIWIGDNIVCLED
jgi:hypothetical protein